LSQEQAPTKDQQRKEVISRRLAGLSPQAVKEAVICLALDFARVWEAFWPLSRQVDDLVVLPDDLESFRLEFCRILHRNFPRDFRQTLGGWDER